MGIANNFPVFEADQVLSNKHLNDLFNYLDQQDRLTRCKLIGSGIVCGLKISHTQQAIHISKGAALTSQGFLVLHCESDYTHFIPYAVREFPKDLSFIKQCGSAEVANIPFYKPGFESDLLELITTDTFNGLDAVEKASATVLANIPGSDLDKYVVVLFLETEQINLKNCDTNDCNDKGSRMDFDVKSLLVRKSVLDEVIKRQGGNVTVMGEDDDTKLIQLKRYNVPVGNLKSSSDVLNGFVSLVDDVLLKKLAQLLSDCYANHKYIFDNEPQDPFANLFTVLSQLREKITTTKPILIQYFYDFIDDLIKAYYELKEKLTRLRTECCGDEMKFPLHLMLGEANVNTDTVRSAYRHHFIYSSLFDPENQKVGEVRILFTRLKLMVDQISFGDIDAFERSPVRITPSRYGYAALSKRCIPYYYKVATANKELYRSWDYRKSSRQRAKLNLSYHASEYATADAVVNPLLYDIEQYDFFRIEGHIGKGINEALSRVKQLQQRFNLPFETIALSADYIGALIKGEEPKCLIQDLESDYRVLIAEFVCRVHDALCLASKVRYTGRPTFFPTVVSSPIANPMLAAGLRLMANPRAVVADVAATATEPAAAVLADDDDEDKLVINAINRLPEAIDHVFASTLVNEFHAVRKYTKGDTLARLCNPGAGLVGSKYTSIVKANNGEFRNPVAFRGVNPISALHFRLFEFIDRIESVISLLMSNELADLNIVDFKTTFKRLETEAKNLKNVSPRIAAEVEITFDSCIVERLEALKNEYSRRAAEYRLAKNFNHYFKKHGGIDHKAGVPTGGTFLLVYHQKRNEKPVDVRSVFINKELSTLMMSHFHGLLKPAVEVNNLEFQSKLLQTATLYREPELFFRFKDVMQKYLDDCRDLPEDRRKEIVNIINRPPEQPRFELNDEMVIADFYVPYLCCSDCPPIAYILPPPPKDETADPTIKIDKNSFCSDDATKFPLVVSPAGGTISGAGIGIEPNGNFVFVPSVAGAGLHTLTYTINNKNASVQVEVKASPVAKFTYKVQVANEEVTLTLANETVGRTNETKYEWFKDGVSFSTVENPDPLTFKLSNPVRRINLVVTNGACPGTFGSDIEIPAPVEILKIVECVVKQKIDLEPNNTVNVKDLDTDATVTNKKKVTIDLKATLTSGKPENFVKYTLPSGTRKEVILVVQSNNADFFMKITEQRLPTGAWVDSSLALEAKNNNASKYSWTIRQGQHIVTSDKHDFEFKFKPNQFVPGDLPILVVLEIKNDSQQCDAGARFEIKNAIYQERKNKDKFDNHNQ